MNGKSFAPAEVLSRLAAVLANVTGFREDVLTPERLERALSHARGERHSPLEVVLRAEQGDPVILEQLSRAVVIPETYLFRQPEHFRFVIEHVATRRRTSGPLRGLSAGCATGEEAFSLAATLLATGWAPGKVEVIGVDLLESNLEMARSGLCSRASLRDSGPELFPVALHLRDGSMQVRDEVRERVQFVRGSLLEPLQLGAFDFIFCRNVLVYLSPSAARKVVDNLTASLAPGGVLVFGPMDVSAVPAQLKRIGSVGLQAYGLASASERKSGASASSGAAEVVPVRLCGGPVPPAPHPSVPTSPWVHRHLEALHLLERGDLGQAERMLTELGESAPDYLPGILERALLALKQGRSRVAMERMKELITRAERLDPQLDLAGPEKLPVSYYLTAARAFFARQGAVK